MNFDPEYKPPECKCSKSKLKAEFLLQPLNLSETDEYLNSDKIEKDIITVLDNFEAK